MNILLIDTTTADLTVAIISDKVYDFSQRECGTHHSEKLCDRVQQALSQRQLAFADLDAYACCVGPGSFTGIRIGVSTVKGYAFACPKPLISFTSLQAIAFSRNMGCKGKGAVDAGNGRYFADYANGVEPCLVGYDDARATDCVADTASQYLDGAAEVVKQKFLRRQFETQLQPLYIRRSQAEENYDKSGAK